MKIRHLAIAGSWLVAAATVGVGVVGALPAGTAPTGSLVTETPLLNPISSGTSADPFVLIIPDEVTNRFCKGDALDGYDFASFFVPSTEDPATLRFSPGGFPELPSNGQAVPMFVAGGGPMKPQPPGLESGVVQGTDLVFGFDNAYFGSQVAIPGEYRVGFACYRTNQPPPPYEIDDYWEVTLSLTTNGGDGANDFDWTMVEATPATTTTTTTTEPDATTTTTEPDVTTTTDPDATTTTTDPDATTTTTDPDATTTTTDPDVTTTTSTRFASSGAGSSSSSGGFTGSPSSGSGTIAATGSSSWTMVALAVVVLVLGRMAILAARRIRVLPPN